LQLDKQNRKEYAFDMDTSFAIKKAGSREALAKMLNVATITTYRWDPALPEKHRRYLQAARPKWFKEWEATSQEWRDSQQKASLL
jgi:hypothetical protein